MEILAACVMLWYVPVIIVTTLVHTFVPQWRILGKTSYFPLYGTGIAIFLGTLALMPYILRLRLSTPGYLIVVGFILFAGGVIFLFWSYVTLSFRKLAWVNELEPISSQSSEPVTVGPYALCRHPVYSAAILIMVSTFLISGVILLAFPLLAIYPLLVHEERELKQRFGESYLRYSKTTPMLLGPHIVSPKNRPGPDAREVESLERSKKAETYGNRTIPT